MNTDNRPCHVCGKKQKFCHGHKRITGGQLITMLGVILASGLFALLALTVGRQDTYTVVGSGRPNNIDHLSLPGQPGPTDLIDPPPLTPEQWDLGDRLLRELFRTHPYPEAQDFERKLKSGEIKINYDEFDVATDPGRVALIVYDPDTQSYLLNVRLSFLSDPSTSRVRKQCTLWHEYQHYKQSERGEVPRLHTSSASHHTPTPVERKLMYWGELEAYEEECLLAKFFQDTSEPYYIAYVREGFDGMVREVNAMYRIVPFWASSAHQLDDWSRQYKAEQRDRRRALFDGRSIVIR